MKADKKVIEKAKRIELEYRDGKRGYIIGLYFNCGDRLYQITVVDEEDKNEVWKRALS